MTASKLPYSHTDITGRTFYHSTKAELGVGDELSGGYSSNYTERSVLRSTGICVKIKVYDHTRSFCAFAYRLSAYRFRKDRFI